MMPPNNLFGGGGGLDAEPAWRSTPPIPRTLGIERTAFEQASIEELGLGAGCVFVSVHPTDGDVRFLLGRERYVSTWKESCRWSGFEGSRKSKDESLAVTAAREASEESLCTVYSEAPLLRRLEEGDYWLRIVLSVSSDKRNPRFHATYVVPIPWDADIPERFRMRRTQLEHVDRLASEWKLVRPRFFGACGAVGPVHELQRDESPIDESSTQQRALCVLCTFQTPTIVTSPWQSVVADDDAAPTDCGSHFRAVVSGHDARGVRTWTHIRNRICSETRALEHPALHVVRDNRWKLVQHVSVARDYLEKDKLRWWTIADLRAALANGGNLRRERFRPFFLPVLQTALDELEASGRRPAAAHDSQVASPSADDVAHKA